LGKIYILSLTYHFIVNVSPKLLIESMFLLILSIRQKYPYKLEEEEEEEEKS
jgi:hypothetical protein